MSPGRIGVIGLVLAVIGGAWAAAVFTGDDDGPSRTDALLLEKARQEDPVAVQDVVEDDDRAAGGPDPTGDGTLDDGTRGGDNGGTNSLDGDQTAGNVGTSGSTLEDGLRRELVHERAGSAVLRRELARERAGSETLRKQLATERRTDTSDGASAGGYAPAPAPAPYGRWGGGGDSSSGGGDT
jgi:hypothetical protein